MRAWLGGEGLLVLRSLVLVVMTGTTTKGNFRAVLRLVLSGGEF